MQPGDIFERHYVVDHLISSTEVGVLAVVRHRQLGTRRVVKLLRDGSLDRLLREGRILAQLTSRHTVRVFDFGTTEGDEPFLLLEHVEGVPLSALLTDGPLPWRRAVALVEQVLASLAEAHAAGLAHRAIRPAHVMVGEHDHVTVIEFGYGEFTDADAASDVVAVAEMLSGMISAVGTPPQIMIWLDQLRSATSDAPQALKMLRKAQVDAAEPDGPLAGGRYEQGAVIDQTAHLTVHRARDTDTGKPVRMTVYPGAPTDAEWQSNFREIVRRHMRLRHRNLATVLDYGVLDDGAPYHIVEDVGGHSLRAAMERGIPTQRSAEICRDCAAALDYVHRLQLHHTALTPDSVFLPPTPAAVSAVVTGFLESELVSQIPGAESDPRSAAPEVLRGAAPSDASDVYALGHLMAATLQGRSLVMVASLAEQMHLSETPFEIERSDELPPGVFDIVDACLSKSVESRPTSRDVLAMFDEALRPAERAQPVPLAVGDTVHDRYELRRVLGKGGFATVFEAFDRDIDRAVALKLLHPHLVDTDERRRFEREGELVFLRLDSNHTLTVHDYGMSREGSYFIATELIEGQTFDVALGERGAFAPRQVAAMVFQVLSSLHEAHGQQIYHRDIKPSNLMLSDRDFRLHTITLPGVWTTVLDFGIATLYDELSDFTSLTATGTAPVTPRYAAPEQLFGEAVGPETDIYSLGLVAYELLTGTPAITGSSTGEVVTRQVSPKSAILPEDVDMPVKLRIAVNRMIRKDRTTRYDSAHEAQSAIMAVIQDA